MKKTFITALALASLVGLASCTALPSTTNGYFGQAPQDRARDQGEPTLHSDGQVYGGRGTHATSKNISF